MKVYIGATFLNERCPKCMKQMLENEKGKYCVNIAGCGYIVRRTET